MYYVYEYFKLYLRWANMQSCAINKLKTESFSLNKKLIQLMAVNLNYKIFF